MSSCPCGDISQEPDRNSKSLLTVYLMAFCSRPICALSAASFLLRGGKFCGILRRLGRRRLLQLFILALQIGILSLQRGILSLQSGILALQIVVFAL